MTNDRPASSGIVALPVANSAATVNTNALRITSVMAMTRARPRRSATTPPMGSMMTSGTACAARTMLSEVGVAPGSSSTPNARAIGMIPLPMLLIVRAPNRRR